jgi:hypothetical protein
MTDALIPNRAMFNFRLTARRFAKPPKLTGDLRDWTDAHRLPDLSALDRRESHADVFLGWHEEGLYAAVSVRGKERPPECQHSHFWLGDGFRIWVDTRDTRGIHRASRYCHQFCFFPDDFTGKQAPVPNAKDEAPVCEPSVLTVAGKKRPGGYDMEIGLPAAALYGWDPAEHPRIGFCYYLKDGELGDQYLTLGGVFPYYQDPSIWAAVDLVPG